MKISRDEKRALVEEQSTSNLSATAYCRERGIHYQNFLRWKKEFTPVVSGGSPAFVELAVESTPSTAAAPYMVAELSLGGAIVLKVFAQTHSRP